MGYTVTLASGEPCEFPDATYHEMWGDVLRIMRCETYEYQRKGTIDPPWWKFWAEPEERTENVKSYRDTMLAAFNMDFVVSFAPTAPPSPQTGNSDHG